MSQGEVPPEPFGRNQEETRDAFDYCEDIRHAVELNEAAKRLKSLAQQAVNKVVTPHVIGLPKYDLRVDLPEGNNAMIISDEDDIVETQPELFIATDVRSISEHGIEFYNRNTRNRLVTSSSDFELSPLFPPEDSPHE